MTSIAHRFRFSIWSDFLLGHPIICDMLPPFDSVIIKLLLSSSLVAFMFWIRASAIAAALRLGQNSFALAFKLLSSCSFPSLAGKRVQ